MKLGDMVRLPEYNVYWWSSAIGIIVAENCALLDTTGEHAWNSYTIHVFLNGRDGKTGRAKFGEYDLELISEAR